MKTPCCYAAKEGCCLYKLFRLSPNELTGKAKRRREMATAEEAPLPFYTFHFTLALGELSNKRICSPLTRLTFPELRRPSGLNKSVCSSFVTATPLQIVVTVVSGVHKSQVAQSAYQRAASKLMRSVSLDVRVYQKPVPAGIEPPSVHCCVTRPFAFFVAMFRPHFPFWR